ncbi:hypothetical protein FJ959_22165 [Mesorhizobium sp. B2-2-4]|uniref:hypothetical protein n=1 Tax=unclassified Mesorhizobium TaxID=325217 RepID=UPI001127516B|nr:MULTISPECIES: hypothetical protein [unclassified Mesorhizobium]TPM53239.1 hypothetical protein FJ959_22165 [Mesorhizobium sp. B2-2-4]TPM62119.1 hypothetical protein FJ965_21205 [Mesorhizobium sp. B2-2-1]TPN68490.1 hypothetical protein FJ984_11685 [Mesorhizobium sp. B1-1-3]
MGKSDLVDIEVRSIHMTDKAILVTADDERRVWLPFSKIEIESTGKPNIFIVTMPESFALEKELI